MVVNPENGQLKQYNLGDISVIGDYDCEKNNFVTNMLFFDDWLFTVDVDGCMK